MRPPGSPAELERRRLRAIEPLQRDVPVHVVAERLGVDRRSVRRWKRAHRGQGRAGLRARPASGRPPKLTVAQRRRLARLVSLQLDRPNRTDASQGMCLLADATIAIAEVAIDPAPPDEVLQIIRAGQGRALGDTKVRLDGVEPGGFGRRPHRVNVQLSEQRQEPRMIVDVVQVIHDDEQLAAGVAGPQAPEGLAHVGHPLASPKQPAQTVGVDVVEAEKLLGALAPMVGRPHALRPAAARPGAATQRAQFQRPPFVEADHRRPRRGRPVELPDAFFFRSNAGSSEVFHVRMRCARSPWRRSSRRTHSSVIGGSNPRRRQYSASLGIVQAEKGKPRSAGLDNAMSISSRTWGPVMMGGRPLGLGACSKVVKPLLLNRWIHSYAMLRWQPTRSATSATGRPRATSAITRYRRWTRTRSVRSLSLAVSTRRSLRVSGRNF